jgi:cytochrome c
MVAQQGGSMGGMGGMMGAGQLPSLKNLEPAKRVQAVTYCKDTYTVTTANAQVRKFWERNLRLMTDASDRGPDKNAPVIVPAGMMAIGRT